MNINSIYPWHHPLWVMLAANIKNSQLPHALLLSGQAGIGKLRLAEALAASLLCENPANDGASCGVCPSCHLMSLHSHPDLLRVRPALLALSERVEAQAGDEADATTVEEVDGETSAAKEKKASRDITIDQVRALGEFVRLAAHRGGRKVALVYPADAMNLVAANALLKALEEPMPGVFFVLVSDRPHRLLPTIASRCHRLAMNTPAENVALDWLRGQCETSAEQLRALGGAPFQVASLAGSGYWETRQVVLSQLLRGPELDAIEAARMVDANLKKFEREAQQGTPAPVELATVVGWMQRWLHDAIAFKLTKSVRYHPDAMEALRSLSCRPLDRLLEFSAWLTTIARQSQHPVNQLLFLEDFFSRYRLLCERSAMIA